MVSDSSRCTMSKTALTLLRTWLDQRKGRGQQHVSLSLDGHLALRQLVSNPIGKRQAPVPAAPAPVVEVPVAPAPPSWPTVEIEAGSVDEKMALLAALVESDSRPFGLGTLRPTAVFGYGPLQPRLMFIGDAPGVEEEMQLEPFVGPAGQLLNKIIQAMGLRRQQLYLTNVCKHRPSMGDDQGPANRSPTAAEMAVGEDYLNTEFGLVQPEVVVALGATAAAGLGFHGPVARLRQRFHERMGIPLVITYHPQDILEQDLAGAGRGLEARRMLWEDILMVMERLQMPISEKQQGYFRSAR
jgi:uracil-DNA glycosylase